MLIEIPRWVHREGSSQLVESMAGLAAAEAEGWRCNPNEPESVFATDEAPAAVEGPSGVISSESEAERVGEDEPEGPAGDEGDDSGVSDPDVADVPEPDAPRRKAGRPKKG